MLEQRVSFLECADLEFYLTSSLILVFSVIGVVKMTSTLHCLPGKGLYKKNKKKYLELTLKYFNETNFVDTEIIL